MPPTAKTAKTDDTLSKQPATDNPVSSPSVGADGMNDTMPPVGLKGVGRVDHAAPVAVHLDHMAKHGTLKPHANQANTSSVSSNLNEGQGSATTVSAPPKPVVNPNKK